MGKIIMPSYLFLILLGLGLAEDQRDDIHPCMGRSSKKYHYNEQCRGLSNGSTKLSKVTLSKAREMGRILSGW